MASGTPDRLDLQVRVGLCLVNHSVTTVQNAQLAVWPGAYKPRAVYLRGRPRLSLGPFSHTEQRSVPGHP